MGEMPADLHGKPSSARWAIPLALVAIVAIAVVYEFARPLAEQGKCGVRGQAQCCRRPTAPGAPSSRSRTPDAAPAHHRVRQARPATTPSQAVPRRQRRDAAFRNGGTTSAPTADMPLVFVFRGTSWIEVKDAKGAIVLSTIGYPGATHAVGGAAPFEVVLGNAEAVTVTCRDGTPFDSVRPYVEAERRPSYCDGPQPR